MITIVSIFLILPIETFISSKTPRVNRLGFLIEDYLFLSDVTDLTINTKKIDAQITPTIAADIA